MNFNISYTETFTEFLAPLNCLADRHKLIIVLRNMLSNALKFTSKSNIKLVDVKVSITSSISASIIDSYSESHTVHVYPLPTLNYMLKIEVVDTGPGMSHVSLIYYCC